MLMHVRFQPYQHGKAVVLESLSLGVSFVTFFFGIVLFSADLQEYMRPVISVGIVAVNVLFMLYAVYLVVFAAVEYFTERCCGDDGHVKEVDDVTKTIEAAEKTLKKQNPATTDRSHPISCRTRG